MGRMMSAARPYAPALLDHPLRIGVGDMRRGAVAGTTHDQHIVVVERQALRTAEDRRAVGAGGDQVALGDHAPAGGAVDHPLLVPLALVLPPLGHHASSSS